MWPPALPRAWSRADFFFILLLILILPRFHYTPRLRLLLIGYVSPRFDDVYDDASGRLLIYALFCLSPFTFYLQYENHDHDLRKHSTMLMT